MTGPLLVLGVVFVSGVAVVIGSEIRYNRERRRLHAERTRRAIADSQRRVLDLEPCAYPDCGCDFDEICHAAIPNAHDAIKAAVTNPKIVIEPKAIPPGHVAMVPDPAPAAWYVPEKPSAVFVKRWMVHNRSRNDMPHGPYKHRKSALRKARQLNGQT